MNQLLHTPEGVRDIYGEEYARKLSVETVMKNKINSYGYEDIQTPTFEFFDVFSREVGTTPSRELYKFFDKEGNTLVLRPDFTPSIARCAAKYFMEEQIPMRFSYMGNTFTNTSNLQGKLKEVTQMGAELINDASVEADAEMISLVIEALKCTGLENFRISIGEMEYFKGLCEEAGLDAETELALRECISGKNYGFSSIFRQEKHQFGKFIFRGRKPVVIRSLFAVYPFTQSVFGGWIFKKQIIFRKKIMSAKKFVSFFLWNSDRKSDFFRALFRQGSDFCFCSCFPAARCVKCLCFTHLHMSRMNPAGDKAFCLSEGAKLSGSRHGR